MDDSQWAILVICALTVVACFFLCGLHVDIAEWWSNRNTKS